MEPNVNLFFDYTEKIMSIPDEVLAKGFTTRQQLLEKQKRENSALLICSSLLGLNHVVMDMAHSMLVDNLPKWRKEKWYKFKIKKLIQEVYSSMSKTIESSKTNSVNDNEYIDEVSDTISESTELDIFKLKNAVRLELNKYHINDSGVLLEMITILLLMTWCKFNYDRVIEKMKSIQDCLYDSWFIKASCGDVLPKWKSLLDEYTAHMKIKDVIDLNSSNMISTGMVILDNKLRASETDPDNEASFEDSNNGSRELLNEAFSILNINGRCF